MWGIINVAFITVHYSYMKNIINFGCPLIYILRSWFKNNEQHWTETKSNKTLNYTELKLIDTKIFPLLSVLLYITRKFSLIISSYTNNKIIDLIQR